MSQVNLVNSGIVWVSPVTLITSDQIYFVASKNQKLIRSFVSFQITGWICVKIPLPYEYLSVVVQLYVVCCQRKVENCPDRQSRYALFVLIGLVR